MWNWVNWELNGEKGVDVCYPARVQRKRSSPALSVLTSDDKGLGEEEADDAVSLVSRG